ncbi:hypothetical protein [Flavobacterium defluvii]|uniref:Guanylate cyclase domain-containing protein n=1 Tax=Flavobacterium defluvii TaxID=370979 RepID=A0A1M5PGX0_9FLAO|nr:hypothetical protein [Flavobacterium defluvii]SHH01036.1 hypothetical protein SAMN05443663_10511 [Flavobacterium defluvii]
MNYSNRLILFVDILGFTNEIYSSINDKSKINILKTTLENLEILFRKNYSGDLMEFSQFSDSIVISFPIDYPGGIYYIVTNASFAMHSLFSNGFICKGVISVGQLYHEGNFLFGPEFLNVMKLEALENMPRITISKKLLKIAEEFPGEGNKDYPKAEIEYILNHLEKVSPTVYEIGWYKDYSSLVGESNEDTQQHYLLIKELIEKNLIKFKSIRIQKKYLYLRKNLLSSREISDFKYKLNYMRYLQLLPKHLIESTSNFLVKMYWKKK